MVCNMDEHFIAIRQLPPLILLSSLVWMSKGIWTVLMVQLPSFSEIFFPIIINVMWLSLQTIDTPFSDLSRMWKFYGTSCALIFISSFWETFSSFSSFFNLCLWSPKLSKIPNFILVSFLYSESPLMVGFVSLRQQTPSVSFFFARLGVFLEHSSGKRPQVGLFLPRSYAALRPFLVTLYPLIRHSLIKHHLEMVVIEEGDSKLRSSELETGLSSNYESEEIGVDTAVLKPLQTPNPPLSSSSLPFHASLSLAVYKRSIWGP